MKCAAHYMPHKNMGAPDEQLVLEDLVMQAMVEVGAVRKPKSWRRPASRRAWCGW